MRALVVGGSGGIGAALAMQFCEREDIDQVVVSWHHRRPVIQHQKLAWLALDLLDEDSIATLFGQVGEIDYVINTVGFLHGKGWSPEKTVSKLDSEQFMFSMSINVLPTLLLAKYARSNLAASERPVFAALSARVGSITDNHSGGWHSYRCSKAALNMALRNISIEWRRVLPRCVVAALHPGTTDTPLSKPFQANVAASQLFSPERAAAHMLNTIDKLTPQDSGNFWTWDGSKLPW